MSVETSVRALLVARSELTDLVGDRVMIEAVDKDSPFPTVGIGCVHSPVFDLDGVTLLYDECTVGVVAWAESASSASDVADQVVLAMAAAPLARGVQLLDRSTDFDTEAGLDAVRLTFKWWQT